MKNYFQVSYWAEKFVKPIDDLKDVTFLVTDIERKNIKECRLLRVESIATPCCEYEGAKASHTLVLNIAGEGIVRTDSNIGKYRFFKNEEDFLNKKSLKLITQVKNASYQLALMESLFAKVTTPRKSSYGYSPEYVVTDNFVWNSEAMRPEEVECFMDASKVGVSCGYGDDARLFSIDGTTSERPIIYCDTTSHMWISEDEAIDSKVYLTKEECAEDNRPKFEITRFTDGEEENDSDKFVEVVLI